MEENKLLKSIRKCCSLICHQKEERCFKIYNYIFPICARCTGIIISFILVLVLLSLKKYVNIIISIFFLLVMCLDWGLQYFKIKESTNTRRFLTGLIGGFGMSYLYYYIITFFIHHINI